MRVFEYSDKDAWFKIKTLSDIEHAGLEITLEDNRPLTWIEVLDLVIYRRRPTTKLYVNKDFADHLVAALNRSIRVVKEVYADARQRT